MAMLVDGYGLSGLLNNVTIGIIAIIPQIIAVSAEERFDRLAIMKAVKPTKVPLAVQIATTRGRSLKGTTIAIPARKNKSQKSKSISRSRIQLPITIYPNVPRAYRDGPTNPNKPPSRPPISVPCVASLITIAPPADIPIIAKRDQDSIPQMQEFRDLSA
jgi:hypothetical protein